MFLENVLKAGKFIKKGSLAQVFSCEFCEISKNIIFIEHLRTTASGRVIYKLINTSTFTSTSNSHQHSGGKLLRCWITCGRWQIHKKILKILSVKCTEWRKTRLIKVPNQSCLIQRIADFQVQTENDHYACQRHFKTVNIKTTCKGVILLIFSWKKLHKYLF